MTSIRELLRIGESILASSGVAEPRREAMSLLMLTTKKDKTFVYAHPDEEVSSHDIEIFNSYVNRRADREPLQYISGVQEFYGLEFHVTPDVLIPRPETEMVVERALEILKFTDKPMICDIGTGSGCIVVSILHEAENVRAMGLDVSPQALKVAERNAASLGVIDRLRLIESDAFGALREEQFGLIVSNPPYVPVRDLHGLQAEVRDFEPRVALTDSSDGLSMIRRIVDGAPKHLTQRGHLLLEIGFDQSRKVAEMFDREIWEVPDLLPDLQGIPRLVSARLI